MVKCFVFILVIFYSWWIFIELSSLPNVVIIFVNLIKLKKDVITTSHLSNLKSNTMKNTVQIYVVFLCCATYFLKIINSLTNFKGWNPLFTLFIGNKFKNSVKWIYRTPPLTIFSNRVEIN